MSGSAAFSMIMFRVNGTVPNNAPTVANPIPDQTGQEGTEFSFTFDATAFADADTGDTLSYSAVESGETALPGWLNFAAETRTFSGTPADGDVGTHTIVVTAADSNGGMISDEFDIVVAANCAAPDFGNRRHFWTGEVTVEPLTLETSTGFSTYAYGFSSSTGVGSVTPASFNLGGAGFDFDAIAVYTMDQGGGIILEFEQTLTAAQQTAFGSLRLQICGGQAEDFSDADFGALVQSYSWNSTYDWSMVASRMVHLSLPPNNAASGKPTITGTAQVGETLTANLGTVADADGLPAGVFPAGYNFQWYRDVNGTPTAITAANSRTYVLTDDDAGKTVTVEVSFKDQLYVPTYTADGVMEDDAPLEKRTSDATDTVMQPPPLVSNMSQTTVSTPATSLGTVAQSFTTGAHPNGYSLDSIVLHGDFDDYTAGTVTLHRITRAGAKVADFNATVSGTDLVLAPTADVWLAPARTYVLLTHGDFPEFSSYWFETAFDAEDAGGETDWSIADGYEIFQTGPMSWHRFDKSLKFTVRGARSTVPRPSNAAAVGKPTIAGVAQVGETLTANLGDVTDANGLPATAFPDGYAI